MIRISNFSAATAPPFHKICQLLGLFMIYGRIDMEEKFISLRY